MSETGDFLEDDDFCKPLERASWAGQSEGDKRWLFASLVLICGTLLAFAWIVSNGQRCVDAATHEATMGLGI